MIYLDADFSLRRGSIAGYVTEEERQNCEWASAMQACLQMAEREQFMQQMRQRNIKDYTTPTRMIVIDNFDYLS